ncbi:MAG: flagellar protein FlgN [Thermodesulfobacteriota bacterium]
MADSIDRLERLWDLLDQEVAAYQVLLRDVREEWQCLRENDPSTLTSLLQAKAIHFNQIREIQQSVREVLSELLGKSPSSFQQAVIDLTDRISSSQMDRVRNYQRTINLLAEQISRINEKNKNFIREVLNYLKDVFSLLTCPAQAEPVYVKDGRKISTPFPPSWMSKKV